jgi:membrane-associated phospholipid phosphatase
LQRQIAVAIVALIVCLVPDRARAQDRRMEWESDWRRTGPLEYATTGGLVIGYLGVRYLVPSAEAALWTRPIWFDTAARNALVVESRDGRQTVARVSDWIALVAILHPVAVDAVIVAGLEDDNWDVAEQLSVINAQSYALSLFLNGVAKRVFARQRPYGAACLKDPEYTEGCEDLDRFRSYWSGHAAMTATGAGLTCAHHTHLPLYGGGAGDLSACLGALAATLTTGTLRIASDAHWATDVVTGHLLGYAAGYLLPTLFYYRGFQSSPSEANQPLTGGPALPPARPQLVYSGVF